MLHVVWLLTISMQRAGCEQSDVSSVHTHNDYITNADVCKVD